MPPLFYYVMLITPYAVSARDHLDTGIYAAATSLFTTSPAIDDATPMMPALRQVRLTRARPRYTLP